ncbi:hypothetical protein, partial [Enterobacter hormaechei]|uniref:hypothetical protein n=1 Tax=Enterobacter hormaechei TaxID=158836 RepID=UPI001F0B6A97
DGSKADISRNLFSSVVQMLRPGVGRWDISGGQILKDDIQDEPNLFQASYYYGLNNYLTGYTDGSKADISRNLFSSVVQMLRPGVGRWDISGGQ